MTLTQCLTPTRRTGTTTGPAAPGRSRLCQTTASARWESPTAAASRVGQGQAARLPPLRIRGVGHGPTGCSSSEAALPGSLGCCREGLAPASAPLQGSWLLAAFPECSWPPWLPNFWQSVPCWLSQAAVPRHARAVPGGTGAANLGQPLSLPWPLVSALPCGMDKGEEPVLCLSPVRPGNVCCAPAASRAPELPRRGREVYVPCRMCPWQGRGQPCWDTILSIAAHTTVPGVPGVVRAQQAEAPSWQKPG